MIRGLGIDAADVDRIGRALARPGFADRVFTAAELTEPNPPRTAAGRWAAKEAGAKALGTRLRWHDLELTHRADGAPELAFTGAGLARWAEIAGGDPPPRLWVSVTHERGLAVAVVVAESV